MSNILTENNPQKYLYIYSDCQLVKGFARTSICDTSRKRIFFIANDYYELTKLFRNNTIGEIIEMLDGNYSQSQFLKFLDFLLVENIATLVDDINCFPEIDEYWDDPSLILNAIVDIRNEIKYLDKALAELSILQCKYLQIRFYEVIGSESLEYIISLIKSKCFKDVEILLKYHRHFTSIKTLEKYIDECNNIRIVVHSAPRSTENAIDSKTIYTSQQINSADHCGVINLNTLNLPSIQGFMENKLYNSCLNRKISVDENGYIKNCPSMGTHYGHIANTSLISVAKNKSFQEIWSMNKSKILTCQDCEFRNICSDCRVYTQNSQINGKPSGCNYNPYIGIWEA